MLGRKKKVSFLNDNANDYFYENSVCSKEEKEEKLRYFRPKETVEE